ncbi:hypothetical protein [Thiothrix winogradskyi]|uniref:Uncharacterized protein n=1 Tax=Thiothrix winogradskyi TaxID=96472 RepID=A0ABY3SYT5_9GAMM|nr:hypothetical protein [Thiothrix winogradskyi]UJS23900.1 hypothetical protein L2Y54_18460 [Thiothrix winogradskyi]
MSGKESLSFAMDDDALALIKRHTGCTDKTAVALFADMRTLMLSKTTGNNSNLNYFNFTNNPENKTDC